MTLLRFVLSGDTSTHIVFFYLRYEILLVFFFCIYFHWLACIRLSDLNLIIITIMMVVEYTNVFAFFVAVALHLVILSFIVSSFVSHIQK